MRFLLTFYYNKNKKLTLQNIHVYKCRQKRKKYYYKNFIIESTVMDIIRILLRYAV